jgi:hypothetical protein
MISAASLNSQKLWRSNDLTFLFIRLLFHLVPLGHIQYSFLCDQIQFDTNSAEQLQDVFGFTGLFPFRFIQR